ncbi:hypothetical protein DXG01_004350, partial [Tephrocybe rancida]
MGLTLTLTQHVAAIACSNSRKTRAAHLSALKSQVDILENKLQLSEAAESSLCAQLRDLKTSAARDLAKQELKSKKTIADLMEHNQRSQTQFQAVNKHLVQTRLELDNVTRQSQNNKKKVERYKRECNWAIARIRTVENLVVTITSRSKDDLRHALDEITDLKAQLAKSKLQIEGQ